jgi:hypothetical protein
MSTDTDIIMKFGSAWGMDRPTSVSDVPSATKFKVEVKNTWSKAMRLKSLKLHVKALQSKETLTLTILTIVNDKEELVCSPQIDINNYGANTLTNTNLTSSNMVITNAVLMERDIIIPAGKTCLFRVAITTDPVGSDVRAEVCDDDYLAYSATMSEITSDTSDEVVKELARLQKELNSLSMSKENELQIKSKANSDLVIQKLLECELRSLMHGATARADILLQTFQKLH